MYKAQQLLIIPYDVTSNISGSRKLFFYSLGSDFCSLTVNCLFAFQKMSAEVQASSPRRKAPAEVAQATRVNFAARLNALPAVTTLRGVATHAYDRAKQSYAFVAVPLQLAEIGVQYAVEKSMPVLDKFSPQLRYVDRLACRGLDNLEAVYPDVTHKQPREILNDTVAFGRSKLASVKEYGVSKVRTVLQSMTD